MKLVIIYFYDVIWITIHHMHAMIRDKRLTRRQRHHVIEPHPIIYTKAIKFFHEQRYVTNELQLLHHARSKDNIRPDLYTIPLLYGLQQNVMMLIQHYDYYMKWNVRMVLYLI
jgi:hypothetical protein